VAVAHIPTFIGRAEAGDVDPSVLGAKIFGRELPEVIDRFDRINQGSRTSDEAERQQRRKQQVKSDGLQNGYGRE
jgi:hypothetical protein